MVLGEAAGGCPRSKPGKAWIQWFVVSACAWSLAVARPAAAQEEPTPAPEGGFRPRVVREGTLSLGAQGQYGAFIANTGFGNDFDAGPGLTVRVRYRTGRESAIGASFESQRYNATTDSVDWLQGIVTTAEYYQYFRVRQRAPRYLLVGAGLLQTTRRLADGDSDFPGDAGVLTLGGGTEIWWKRTVTFDLSVRYYGFIRGGPNGLSDARLSHAVQAALGLHFYTSR